MVWAAHAGDPGDNAARTPRATASDPAEHRDLDGQIDLLLEHGHLGPTTTNDKPMDHEENDLRLDYQQPRFSVFLAREWQARTSAA